MLCENFNEKKIKTLFVVSCPKLLCCQRKYFGPLGVNKQNLYIFVVVFTYLSKLHQASLNNVQWDTLTCHISACDANLSKPHYFKLVDVETNLWNFE